MKVLLNKLFLIITIIIFCTIILSGCWSLEELNDLGLAGALGIDKKEENINIIFEIYYPRSNTQKGGEKKPAVYVESKGKSFFDAIRNATLSFDKKIFFSHIKVILISENAARGGIIKYLDLWSRQSQPRQTTYLLITKNALPSEIIGVAGGMEEVSTDYIQSIINNQEDNAKSLSISTLKYMQYYYSSKIQPIVGIIQRKKKNKLIGQNKQSQYILSVEGAAVFKEDRFMGYLDGRETRGLNFITGNVKSGIIVSPAPDHEGNNSVEILQAEADNDVIILSDGAKININIEVLGMLGEETGSINTRKPSVIEKIEKNNSKQIKKEVEDILKKCQKNYCSDIFGFGRIAYRKNPDKWKKIKDDWERIFSQAEIHVNVQTDIKRLGLINFPAVKRGEKMGYGK